MRFLLSAELTASLAFALYLFIVRWNLTETEAVRAVAFSSLLGAVGVVLGALLLVFSKVSALHASAVLNIALVLLTAGMLGRGFAPSVSLFQIATLVGGFAIGLGMGANKARAFALLPTERAGFGLGLVAAMGGVAGTVAPLGASLLLDLGALLGPMSDAYAGTYLLLAVPPAIALALSRTLRRTELPGRAGPGRAARRVLPRPYFNLHRAKIRR